MTTVSPRGQRAPKPEWAPLPKCDRLNLCALPYRVTVDTDRFAAEAHTRWGDTPEWAQSQRRTADYGPEQWAAAQADQSAAEDLFMAAMLSGCPAESPEAAAAVDAHRAAITAWYYECSPQMQVNLAEMYVADDRFRRHYDDRAPGLAEYVHAAIVARHA